MNGIVCRFWYGRIVWTGVFKPADYRRPVTQEPAQHPARAQFFDLAGKYSPDRLGASQSAIEHRTHE
jgi:hypothetical protein